MMLLKESSKIWDMSLNLPEAELMKNEQKKSIKPYGTWQSKISAELIAQATPGLSSLRNFNDTLFGLRAGHGKEVEMSSCANIKMEKLVMFFQLPSVIKARYMNMEEPRLL